MNNLNLIAKWLSLFWQSWVFALNDISKNATAKKWQFDWSINHELNTYVTLNSDNPFGLFFTPSWNLGKKNKIWDKIVRWKADCENYIPAFYIDIDIKDSEYTSMEKLKAAVLDVIISENLPVSYMLESWWGFHLYMFVEQWHQWKLQWIKFKEIQEEFAKRFPWWDLSSHSLNKLMRLPFSNHWKTLQPIPTKLYRVWKEPDEVELEEVTSEDQIEFPHLYLPHQYLENLNSNLKEKSDIRIDMASWVQQKELTEDTNIINNVEIIKVIKILDKKNDLYPKHYMWYNYRFFIDPDKWTKIHLQTTNLEDWLVNDLETSGYRINLDDNYVHNFSWDKHPMEERPRGWTFSFLYHYFDKDIKKVKNFLEKEFWIILKQKENFWYLNIKTFNWVIVFSKEWVFYNKEVKTKQWTDMIQKTLFEVPIEIVWVFSSKYTAYWEAEHNHNYYMIKRLDMEENNEVIVNFNVDRKSFNRTFWSTWLVFFWNEEDMLSFYSALNKASMAWQVKTLDFEYLNWIKKDKLILWDKVYDKDFNLITDDNLVLKTQHIEMNMRGKEECSVWEFAEKFIQLFSDRVSVLAVSTYITLFLWHEFWKVIWDYKQQSLIPWLIVSWKTRAGKTTLLSILKEWSWLSIDTRKFSIKSTTPQPLKQAGTDAFILHLEEFTGDISPDKETIIRDILNKSISARWTLSWENVSFVYRSSLILDWERLPTSQSVVNRTVLIPMFESDKEWNEALLYDIKQFLFLPDLVKKALWLSDEDKITAFKKAEEVLLKNWITWRNVLLYSFVLATNYMIKIVDNSLLLDTIKQNFELLWQADLDSDDVSSLLSHFIISNRIRPSLNYSTFEDSWNSKLVWTITLNQEILAEKRVDIIGMLKAYKWEVTIEWFTLKFNTDKTSKLWTKLLNYRQYFNFLN